MWSGCPWLWERPQPLSISPGAWGGVREHRAAWRTDRHRNGNSLVWLIGVGTGHCRQCQASSDLGHGAGSRASWVGAWLLYKHSVSFLSLQLLCRCLLLPFLSPFSSSDSWWHKSHQQRSDWCPGNSRMLPMLCGLSITLLGRFRVSCRCSGLGQRKSTPSPLHVSQKGPLPPSFSSCGARQRHSRNTVTAGSASLGAWRGFLHSTTVALHTQPSSCAEISSGITSGQPFLLTSVVSGSHTPWCVLSLTATVHLGQVGPCCSFLLF